MATKNLIPRSDGEGGIGKPTAAWGSGVFKTGAFEELTVQGNAVSTGSFTETNDLSSSVTWADVPDANITESSVVQHSGALSVQSSQISDLSSQGFLTLQDSGSVAIGADQIDFNSSLIPDTNASYDLGSAEKKIRHLFLSDNSLHIGGTTISAGDTLGDIQIPSGITVNGASRFMGGSSSSDTSIAIGGEGSNGEAFVQKWNSTNKSLSFYPWGGNSEDGFVLQADGNTSFGPSGIKVGSASIKPDPNNPEVVSFDKVPKVSDSEGNPVTILTADKLGLGTSAVLSGTSQDIQFKLLTDENRFVVGTTGEGGLASGWYRFNDFQVKGATDVGAHTLNPVDTRIYSDSDSFVYMTRDAYGNRVAHLVGGDEQVSPANNIALGLAVKIDDTDTPQDIEFTHTDGEQYSLINGDSDSKDVNGIPIRQGFQGASIGGVASPLLIDGGYF